MNSYKEIIRNRFLLLSATKNDLRTRYAGQLIGQWWLILSPIILLSIYAAIYVYIFRLKPTEMKLVTYILYIFSGLVPFLCIAESLNSGTNSLTSNISILKNITFPITIIPLKANLIAHINLMLGLLIIMIADAVFDKITIHILFIPLIVVLQFIFLSGISLILSLLNVIIKDTSTLITYLIMVIMIASPIAYTKSMVPAQLKFLLYLNPFVPYFELYQSTIALNETPAASTFLLATGISLCTFFVAERIFRTARKIILNYV